MLQARHAAVVAGLGVAGQFVLPRGASAWEGAAASAFVGELPLAAFAVGIAAGVAVGGAVLVVSGAAKKSPKNVKGKHFAANVDAKNRMKAEQDTVPLARGSKHMRLEAEPTMPPVGMHARVGKHFASAEAVPGASGLEARVPSPEVTDYVYVAQRYVASERQQKKNALRSRGVASVLLERMDLKRGFPSIERGVSQVDNSDEWWVDLEPVTSSVTAAPAPKAMPLPELSIEEKRAIARENAAKRLAAERISRAVAQVDQGVYPELRTVEEVGEEEDLWTMALTAMDDLMPPIIFSDNVGNADTIDEPDGLELPTQFLRVRDRESVPEFHDATAFVDYALDDEFSQSATGVLRSRTGTFLKVIEGGTQSTARLERHTRASHETKANAYGKHFAEAAEA